MKYKKWRNRLIGNKIDSVTVIKDTGKRKNRVIIWLCQCECGEYVELNSAYLKRKDRYKACKTCNEKIRVKKCREENIKHGHSSINGVSITYSSWVSMVQRCLNSNNNTYERYGKQGITVCDRWIKFENFLEDMRERPSKEYTIDRIDGTKGYYKNNCRWATREEQSQNRKNVLSKKEIIEIKKLLKENKLSQKEISEKFNRHIGTISLIKRGKTWKNI